MIDTHFARDVASRFFANTYPTRGLKNLLANVCRRLTGAEGEVASVFRLDTSYDGGKSHGLIALCHAARGMRNHLTRTSLTRTYGVCMLPPKRAGKPAGPQTGGRRMAVATDVESRLSRLEGIIEQINHRLDSLDRRLDRQGQRLDSGFRWIIGLQLTSFLMLGTLIMLWL